MEAFVSSVGATFTVAGVTAALDQAKIPYRIYESGDFDFFNPDRCYREVAIEQEEADLDDEDNWQAMEASTTGAENGYFSGYFFEPTGAETENAIIWALLQGIPNSYYSHVECNLDHPYRVATQASFNGVIAHLIAQGELDDGNINSQTAVYLAADVMALRDVVDADLAEQDMMAEMDMDFDEDGEFE